MNALASQAAQYHEQALASPDALAYLHGRGLEDRTIRRFQLGYISKPLSSETEKYRGCVTIPYLTLSGNCSLLKVRTGWPKPKPKYLPVASDFPLSEPKVRLFNARHAMPTPRSNVVAIVEGELDCAIAVQAGARAVSVPSATTFYERWAYLFEDAKVIIALDGDEAGQAGATKLSGMFRQRRIEHEVRPLPKDLDVTDLYLQRGTDSVLRALT